MARASGGGEDEYQALQMRFQALESERKNLFEHTQVDVCHVCHVCLCAEDMTRRDTLSRRRNTTLPEFCHPGLIVVESCLVASVKVRDETLNANVT